MKIYKENNEHRDTTHKGRMGGEKIYITKGMKPWFVTGETTYFFTFSVFTLSCGSVYKTSGCSLQIGTHFL